MQYVQNTILNERTEDRFEAAGLVCLETFSLDPSGDTFLKELQFIADCFGYSLLVRNSTYVGERKRSPDMTKSPKGRGAEHWE